MGFRGPGAAPPRLAPCPLQEGLVTRVPWAGPWPLRCRGNTGQHTGAEWTGAGRAQGRAGCIQELSSGRLGSTSGSAGQGWAGLLQRVGGASAGGVGGALAARELTWKVVSQGWREVEERCGAGGTGPAGSFCAPDSQSQGTLSPFSPPRGVPVPRAPGRRWLGCPSASGPAVCGRRAPPGGLTGRNRPGFRSRGLRDPSAVHTFGASSPGCEDAFPCKACS